MLCCPTLAPHLSELNDLKRAREGLSHRVHALAVVPVGISHRRCKQLVQSRTGKVTGSLFVLFVSITPATPFAPLLSLSLCLTNSVDGKEVCAGDYVFVRCGDGGDDEEEEGGANSLEIARVEKVCPDGRLRVLWAYHPAHPNVPRDIEFGPYEILLSDHKDTVQVGCLMGFAEVEENCKSCECAPQWCWNKRYKARQRKVVASDRPAKRRSLGV